MFFLHEGFAPGVLAGDVGAVEGFEDGAEVGEVHGRAIFEEGDQVYEFLVVGVGFPGGNDDGVVGLVAGAGWVGVENDDFTGVPVEEVEILKCG